MKYLNIDVKCINHNDLQAHIDGKRIHSGGLVAPRRRHHGFLVKE
jgi:hypothetical protein